MHKGRLEAFSDGVIAIIITVMVLELRPPQSADPAALRALLPIFLGYVLSFVNLGISLKHYLTSPKCPGVDNLNCHFIPCGIHVVRNQLFPHGCDGA